MNGLETIKKINKKAVKTARKLSFTPDTKNLDKFKKRFGLKGNK